MTRVRIFGSDLPFCEWMRRCEDLPSFSADVGFVSTDVDLVVHRYLSAVDGQGSREVQGIMHVEVKTRRGLPSKSQLDTLSKLNAFSGQIKTGGILVRNFGVFLLSLDNTTPENSERMMWGVLPKRSFITDPKVAKWTPIDKRKLLQLLRFEIHPRNLTPQPFRRHHCTREVVVHETTPLGFSVDATIVTRS